MKVTWDKVKIKRKIAESLVKKKLLHIKGVKDIIGGKS